MDPFAHIRVGDPGATVENTCSLTAADKLLGLSRRDARVNKDWGVREEWTVARENVVLRGPFFALNMRPVRTEYDRQ